MPSLAFSLTDLACGDPLAIEPFYMKHFGFSGGTFRETGKCVIVIFAH